MIGCLLASPALAQLGLSTGGIHGKVVDEQGSALPRVAVTVMGPGAPITLETDKRGEFHLVNLSPGSYRLLLNREGFATVDRENVTVALGRDTELTIPMTLSRVTASVTVSSDSPIIDTRRVETGAAISQQELRDIPTARDPWVILQSIPGVQIDRVNVAGSESGQQSGFSAKGAVGGTFEVDGVNLGLGSSNAYYDFDSFQEMKVVTGGSDPSVQGSWVHLNMITKRGTNEIHGSARIFDVDHHFQSNNLPSEAVGQGLTDGNHIESIQDVGIEAGGPLWKNRLWLWGSYGRNQIDLITAGGGQDKTTLEDFNAKLNAQVVSSNSLELWYLRWAKLKFGRGAGPTHPQPTTWDQTNSQNTWKIEDSQVFSSNLFLSIGYSGQNGIFQLRPEGGPSTQAFLDQDGVWHNTYEYFASPLAQHQLKADASLFFNTGSIGHELKAGFSYLKVGNTSTSSWPGDGSGGLAAQTYGDLFDCAVPCAVITRSSSFGLELDYRGAFVSDTLTKDSLTANLGLRWDEQYGTNLAVSAPANPTFPQILPALSYPARRTEFTWKNWQPRIGLTYALGSHRNSVFKASYSKYAEVLGALPVLSTGSSVGAAYAYYAWNDANHDNLVQPNEVDTSPAGFQFARNYNPQAPGSAALPLNGVDPNLRAPQTDEIVFGVEHELLPAFAVGLNYTYRKFRGEIYSPTNAFDPNSGYRLSSSDYEQYATLTGTTPDGVAYSQPVYRIKQSVLESLGLCTPNPDGSISCQAPPGSFVTNRRDFHSTYNGVELVLTKRLSDGWMVRGSFTYNNNRQHLDGPRACVDPTNQFSFFSTTNAQPCRNDLVAVYPFRGSVFLNSKWQFSFIGLYQLPMGFNFAGNVYGRQGYPINWYAQAPPSGTDGLVRNVFVVPADASRYASVFEVDLRLEKVIHLAATSTLTLSADLFNVTNQSTVLQRQNRLGLDSTNQIREIQSPRIWRFGARLAF